MRSALLLVLLTTASTVTAGPLFIDPGLFALNTVLDDAFANVHLSRVSVTSDIDNGSPMAQIAGPGASIWAGNGVFASEGGDEHWVSAISQINNSWALRGIRVDVMGGGSFVSVDFFPDPTDLDAAILQTYLADGSLVGNITGESMTPFRLELDGYFDYILTSGSDPLRIGPMTVTLATVPEPPVTLLVLVGLVCLTRIRRARAFSDTFTSKA